MAKELKAPKAKKDQVENLSLDFTPHKYQVEMWRNFKRRNVLICTRRWGKTVFGVMTMLHFMGELAGRKKPPKFAYIAPVKDQAKQNTWPIIKEYLAPLIKLNDKYRREVIKIKDAEMEVHFNGGQFKLYGADKGNAEGIRGSYLDGAILDETDDVPIGVWDDIIEPTLSDTRGWLIACGSVKGMGNLYNLQKTYRDNPEWNVGYYKFSECWQNLPAYCDYDEELGLWLPAADKYAAVMDKAKTSPNSFRREYECDFNADGSDPLITSSVLAAAIERPVNKEANEGEPKVMGVDVAGEGPDSHVIVIRHGDYIEKIQKLNGPDEMELSAIIARYLSDDRIGIDQGFIDHTGGYGAGCLARLRQLGFGSRMIGVNFGKAATSGNYADKRTEMYHGIRDWLSETGSIPNNEDLIQELSIMEAPEQTTGKARLMKKDDIRKKINRSPDTADALALTFAMPVHKRRGGAGGTTTVIGRHTAAGQQQWKSSRFRR